MSKVINFPSADARPGDDEEFLVGVELEGGDEIDHVSECLKAFQDDREHVDVLAVVAVGTDGKLRWGSSTHNILEILWMAKALERVMMDRSLGVMPGFDEYED